MNRYFECKISYTAVDKRSGKEKKVTLPYLVDAVSFTEAETRINKEMESVISGKFVVKNITPTKYTDIFANDNGDRWYKCKVDYTLVDENLGKEKAVSNLMLTEACSVKEAFDNLQEALKSMTVDFDAVAISETKIQDIFLYFEPKEESSTEADG